MAIAAIPAFAPCFPILDKTNWSIRAQLLVTTLPCARGIAVYCLDLEIFQRLRDAPPRRPCGCGIVFLLREPCSTATNALRNTPLGSLAWAYEPGPPSRAAKSLFPSCPTAQNKSPTPSPPSVVGHPEPEPCTSLWQLFHPKGLEARTRRSGHRSVPKSRRFTVRSASRPTAYRADT